MSLAQLLANLLYPCGLRYIFYLLIESLTNSSPERRHRAAWFLIAFSFFLLLSTSFPLQVLPLSLKDNVFLLPSHPHILVRKPFFLFAPFLILSSPFTISPSATFINFPHGASFLLACFPACYYASVVFKRSGCLLQAPTFYSLPPPPVRLFRCVRWLFSLLLEFSATS